MSNHEISKRRLPKREGFEYNSPLEEKDEPKEESLRHIRDIKIANMVSNWNDFILGENESQFLVTEGDPRFDDLFKNLRSVDDLNVREFKKFLTPEFSTQLSKGSSNMMIDDLFDKFIDYFLERLDKGERKTEWKEVVVLLENWNSLCRKRGLGFFMEGKRAEKFLETLGSIKVMKASDFADYIRNFLSGETRRPHFEDLLAEFVSQQSE